jgi:hypothetical protein
MILHFVVTCILMLVHFIRLCFVCWAVNELMWLCVWDGLAYAYIYTIVLFALAII